MATKDFVEFTPTSGSGNGTANVETGPNYSMEDKSVNLNVTGSGGFPLKAVRVTQEGIPFMILKSLFPCFQTIKNVTPYSVNIYSDSNGIFTFEVEAQTFLNMLSYSNDVMYYFNIYVPNVTNLIIHLENVSETKNYSLLKNGNIFYTDENIANTMFTDLTNINVESDSIIYQIMSGNKIICQYKVV